tara:strand:+ start:292 stop:507 length:216 start_codon:yes stop_codon:yes gene_type:complete
MISTSDGSLPSKEEEAKAFAKQYAKEFQEEHDQKMQKVVDAKKYNPGDIAMKGVPGLDLKSKIESGQVKII